MFKKIFAPEIFTPAVDALLIPPCCSALRWGFRFVHADWRAFLRDSLLFWCPACAKTYPSATGVLKEMSLLNSRLLAANEKPKNSNFRFGVVIPFDSYLLLEPLYRRLTPAADSGSPAPGFELPDLGQELEQHAGILVADGKPPLEIDRRGKEGIKLISLAFYCLECKRSTPVVSRRAPTADGGPPACAHCGRPLKIPKRPLRGLLDCFESVQKSIDLSNRQQLLVLPLAPGHNPWGNV